MGYNVDGNGHIVFQDAEHEQSAYDALCALNWRNDLKHGGNADTSFQQNLEDGPHPDRWFSWMPWNYHETCKDLLGILEELGFEMIDRQEGNDNTITYYLYYSNKTGDEELFAQTMAPFVAWGDVEWVGEDSEHWRWHFNNGEFHLQWGQIVYE